jgi:hypothetical protein
VTLKEGGADRLDEVVVAILDDDAADYWARGLPLGVTQEEADTFVWGAWEFDANASTDAAAGQGSHPRFGVSRRVADSGRA